MPPAPESTRRARPDDLPRLTEIYNHYIETSHATFDVTPFSVAERQQWFAQFGATRFQCWVLEAPSTVLGYACSTPLKSKQAYETSVEVSIYLHAEATGSGRGRRLYDALIPALREQDLHRAYAGIALPNDGSVAVHAAFGFEEIGTYTEVGRKFGRYWDVLWMQLNLS